MISTPEPDAPEESVLAAARLIVKALAGLKLGQPVTVTAPAVTVQPSPAPVVKVQLPATPAPAPRKLTVTVTDHFPNTGRIRQLTIEES